MDLLWMLLLLLVLLPSQAQRVEEVRAELGQDVTLTCSINHHDIFWFMEIHHKFRIGIGNIFSLNSPSYKSPDFKTNFLIAGKTLEIKNVSAEDIRWYFCGRKEDSRTVDVETFRLISAWLAPSTPSSPTSPSLSTTSRTPADWLTEPAVVGSLALNAVLIVSLLGLVGACMKRNGCCCCCRAKDSAESSLDHQEMQNPQNKIIQLSPTGVLSERHQQRVRATLLLVLQEQREEQELQLMGWRKSLKNRENHHPHMENTWNNGEPSQERLTDHNYSQRSSRRSQRKPGQHLELCRPQRSGFNNQKERLGQRFQRRTC
ncbi:uncharacterized protein V3H82_023443 [Fundulus diaphanus]